MSHFRDRPATVLRRPVVIWVPVFQLLLTVVAGVLCGIVSLNLSAAILIGGFIASGGQAYFSLRALRSFGSVDAGAVIASTYSAMWGKWAIIIAGSLLAVMTIEELNAAVLYGSLFIVHTAGALLLPVLVKRTT